MPASAEQKRIIDLEVSPESIWGSPERQSSIAMRPQGSALGFDVVNLVVSQRWKRAQGALGRLDRRRLAEEALAGVGGAITLNVELFGNGLFKGAQIGDSRIGIGRGIDTWQRGRYSFDGVNDVLTAIQLHRLAALALRPTRGVDGAQVQDPYIQEDSYGGHWFWLRNLGVPPRFMAEARPLLSKREQERILLESSNIAGQFGVKVLRAEFHDQTGILGLIEVGELSWEGRGVAIIDADGAYSTGLYLSDPWQAAALLGIGANMTNYLLDKQEESGGLVQDVRPRA